MKKEINDLWKLIVIFLTKDVLDQYRKLPRSDNNNIFFYNSDIRVLVEYIDKQDIKINTTKKQWQDACAELMHAVATHTGRL